MNEAEANPQQETGYEHLAQLLAGLDIMLREGKNFETATLRGFFMRLNQHETLRDRICELLPRWPSWAKAAELRAMLLETARSNGDTRPFIELYLDLHATAPEVELLPLQAWTVLHWYFCEGGPSSGAPLPDWVWDYLNRTADNVQRLRCREGEDVTARIRELPHALGFVQGKRNVFRADEQSLRDSVAALAYDQAGQGGATGESRIEPVMQLLGITDARTARLRVARGRKRFKPAPGWAT